MHCDSWKQALYDCLIQEGHAVFEVIPWAIQKRMHAVGPTKKKAALLAHAHGLLPREVWNGAMCNFKDSRFYLVARPPNLDITLRTKTLCRTGMRRCKMQSWHTFVTSRLRIRARRTCMQYGSGLQVAYTISS